MTKTSSPIVHNAQILNTFPGPVRRDLGAFFNFIAAIEADYTIFIARKAVRLYDLGVFMGFPEIKNKIFTHHILDQDISFMKGKRISIVDDTFIVGTTLCNIEKQLREAGIADLHVTVFCRDKYWSSADLANIDTSFKQLSSDEVLNFCAAEIEAFRKAGLPYLTDFPISAVRRFNHTDIEKIFGSIEWIAYSTNAYYDEDHTSTAHTFIPTIHALQKLSDKYRISLSDLVEIIKVRMFLWPIGDGNFYVRFVPLVTLRSVDRFQLSAAVNKIQKLLKDNTNVVGDLTSPKSQVRFIQHLLSGLIYRDFAESINRQLKSKTLPAINYSETGRHFGGAACHALQVLCSTALAEQEIAKHLAALDKWLSKPLRRSVVSDMISEVIQYLRLSGLRSKRKIFDPKYFFADMMKVFIEFYNKIEIPTREKILEEKKEKGFVDISKIGTTSRLQAGVTWSALLSAITNEEPNWHIRQITSVYLDKLVDMGVAVPTLIEENDRVFRGYRHGEDVLLGEQEYALCHIAAEKYLEAAGRKSMPTVDAEKLFVLLVKIGASLNYIDEVQGSEYHENLARVQFHRHGAVVVLDPYVKGTFAGSIEHWLTSRLINRGILSKSGRNLRLGDCPAASFKNRASITFAQQLGMLIGELSSGNRNRVLDTNDLVLLSSTSNIFDTLGAVAAELQVFCNSFSSIKASFSGKVVSGADAFDRYEVIRGHDAVQALNSATRKFRGYIDGEFDVIVRKAEDHLSRQLDGAFRLASWKNFVEQLKPSHRNLATDEVENSLRRSMCCVVDLLVIVYSYEIALVALMQKFEFERADRLFGQTISKIDNFYRNVGDRFVGVSPHAALHRRLKLISSGEKPIEDVDAAVSYSYPILLQETIEARRIYENASRVAFTVGRQSRIITYSSAVWYDVVGSTSEEFHDDLDVVSIRGGQVERFTEDVNGYLQRLISESRGNSSVRRRPDYAMDQNDERTVLFGGSGAKYSAELCVRTMLEFSMLRTLRLRVLFYPCNTISAAPTSLRDRANVEGVIFFQVFSRLKREITRISRKYEADLGTGSLLWLGGNYNEDRFSMDGRTVGKVGGMELVKAEVGGISASVPFSLYHVS